MEAENVPLYLENSLIWFGAGVSIAEILTGYVSGASGIPEGTCRDHHRPCDRLPDDVLRGG